MTRTARRSTIVALAWAIVLTITTCACATDPPASPYSTEDSVTVFDGFVIDYDPAASPAALAEHSDLVVSGTIERVQEGRVVISPGNENAPDVTTIVLVLREAEAVLGSLEQGDDGFVYIELPNPGQQEPSAYNEGLFAGSNVVAYLMPAFDGALVEGTDVAIADPEAGRPAGQTLYQPLGPQALILQYDDEAVVWPLLGATRDGRLEDALPGGTLIAG